MCQINYEPTNFYTPLSYVRPIHQNKINKLTALVYNWKKNTYIKHIFFLVASPLQAPLTHK